jgi:hypothetical protein
MCVGILTAVAEVFGRVILVGIYGATASVFTGTTYNISAGLQLISASLLVLVQHLKTDIFNQLYIFRVCWYLHRKSSALL